MEKRCVKTFSILMISLILLMPVVFAQEDGEEPSFLEKIVNRVTGGVVTGYAADDGGFDNCDDYCNDFWMTAMPACPGEQATTGVFPDCECGWECDDDLDEFDKSKIMKKLGL